MSESKQPKFNLKTVNILAESKHRVLEVEMLKKITIDGTISTQRAFISFGISVLLFVVIMSLLMSDGNRIPFIFIPLLVFAIGCVILILNYMLSSRNKSMLNSVVILLNDRLIEKIRRKTGRKGDLKSFGIEDFDESTGLIHFRDNRVGRMYRVEGQLSRSTLPSVANGVAMARAQYLIGRSSTSNEKLITSIRNIDLRNQLKSYIDCYEKASSGSQDDEWRRHMSALMFNYVDDEIDNKQITVTQVVILSDYDEAAFLRSETEFFSAVNKGMYVNVQPVTTQRDLVEIVAPMLLLSKGGAKKYGINE